MRFLWPELLWFLLLAPLLAGAYVWALRRRKRIAVRYASLILVRDALGPGQGLRRHVPPALFLLAMVVAIVAVARPSTVFVLPSQHQTIILAMDVSRSMRAADVEPDRITAAQSAAKAFIEEMPSDVKVGIVSFAGTASIVQTPTDKREDLLAAIDRFQLQRGTATGSGLLLSLSLLLPDAGIDLESLVFGNAFSRPWEAPAADRPKKIAKPEQKPFTPVAPGTYKSGAIILLSDGRRTTGPDPLGAAKMAADRGVRVHTVGFGTKEGGKIGFEGWSIYVTLDEETLKSVAHITAGEYFYAGTSADLRKVYQTLNAKFAMERTETEVSALFSAVAFLLVAGACLLSLYWYRRTA